MERNFKRSLSLVLEHEGGYVDHPKDPGGATNKGVTIANYRRFVDKTGTKEDLKDLTVEQAAAVYKKQYWDKVKGDQLPDGVDYAVFDFGVNSGPNRSIKYLQEVVGVDVDGQLGPLTLAAVNRTSAPYIIQHLCRNRMSFLKRLKTFKTFGNGWTARVSAVEIDATSMSKQPTEKHTGATFEYGAPKPQEPIVRKETPKGLDKPMAKSKTVWATVLAGSTGIISALSSLDWRVASLIVVVTVVCGFVVLRERHKYAKQARDIIADISNV